MAKTTRATLLKAARAEWRIKMTTAAARLAIYGLSIERKIGSVTLDDAVDAMKKEAGELLEDLRR